MKNKKKSFLLLAGAAFIALPLMGCDLPGTKDNNGDNNQQQQQEQKVEVTDLTVQESTLQLKPGDTKKLTVTVSPENATDKSVKYSSSAINVATVSEDGTVTAVADGSATIIVQSVSNPSLTKLVNVVVETEFVNVTDITLVKSSFELLEGQEEQITATVSPTNATNKSITYSSTNTAVATVSAAGLIHAVKAGTAVINIISSANPAVFKQATVVVKRDHINVESIEVSENSLTVLLGSDTPLTATVSPEDASDKSLTWESSNPAIATVDATGKVHAVAIGSTSITVTSVDNPACFKVITINVEAEVHEVESVALNKHALTIPENGAAQTLVATVLPDNASNKSLIWTSSDESVAVVNAKGEVSPRKAGTTIIQVTTVDGGHHDECTVTIEKIALESIALSETSIEFSVEDQGPDAQKQLSYTLNPTNPTYTEVTWASTNTAVATVTSTGLVEKVGEGTCNIIATHSNSGKFASCSVAVKKVEAANIELNTNELYFVTSGSQITQQLTVTFTPENVTHKEIEWSSTNTAVATVSDSGLVTRVAEGEATIIARHIDSNKVAYCNVYVTANSVYVIRGTQPAANYTTYTINKGAKANTLEEFVAHDLEYKVGDDNALSFEPVLSLYKGKEVVDQSFYTGGYSVKVEKKINASYVAAPATEFAVDEAKATVDFDASAIGNSYKISVYPLDIDEDDIEDYTQTYLIQVIDGYNVTSVEEFSMLDTTNSSHRYSSSGDLKNTYSDWEAYKDAHGIDKNLHPSTMILHKNLKINRSAIPSNLFYNESDAVAGEWNDLERSRSVGSLKDRVYLYSKNTAGNVNIYGNYFSIDWSELPLVSRPDGVSQTEKKLNSHSSFVRLYAGSLNVEDVNIIGNSHVAKTDADIKFDGGIIGFKFCDDSISGTFKNILEHGCYIGLMSEGGTSANPASISVENSKFYDNNNCFLYNWGGPMYAKNSLFEGCGGPVVIQDHTGVDIDGGQPFDQIDDVNGRFVMNGHVPQTVFEDCTINNYVIGTESWFKSFGAQSLAPQIKSMSDTLSMCNPTGGRTFVFDSDKKGVLAQAASGDTVMNFVVLNKSSEAEAMTAYPVDGEVKFINNGVVRDQFNYFRPTDMQEMSLEELSRFTAEATFNQYFRGAQAAGSAVFETAGGSYCIYNENPPAIGDIQSVVEGSPAAPSPDVVTNAHENVALYYNGMMLVFGLGYIGR